MNEKAKMAAYPAAKIKKPRLQRNTPFGFVSQFLCFLWFFGQTVYLAKNEGLTAWQRASLDQTVRECLNGGPFLDVYHKNRPKISSAARPCGAGPCGITSDAAGTEVPGPLG